jgi:hypothetical protein
MSNKKGDVPNWKNVTAKIKRREKIVGSRYFFPK